MDDQTKAAFAAVTDLTKQLITLGTTVVTVEITFGTGFAKPLSYYWQVGWSWGCLLACVVAGVWVLMAVAGKLGKSATLNPAMVYAATIVWPARIQVVTFVLGMIFTALYGIKVLQGPPSG